MDPLASHSPVIILMCILIMNHASMLEIELKEMAGYHVESWKDLLLYEPFLTGHAISMNP
jgi:hypothetical protein